MDVDVDPELRNGEGMGGGGGLTTRSPGQLSTPSAAGQLSTPHPHDQPSTLSHPKESQPLAPPITLGAPLDDSQIDPSLGGVGLSRNGVGLVPSSSSPDHLPRQGEFGRGLVDESDRHPRDDYSNRHPPNDYSNQRPPNDSSNSHPPSDFTTPHPTTNPPAPHPPLDDPNPTLATPGGANAPSMTVHVMRVATHDGSARRPRSPYVKWTKEEDELLAQAVAKYGQKWDLVQKAVPSRGYHQVRQRWLRTTGTYDGS
ncbi:hypothetical protein JAAARDRAFT_214606 [Jaapia argillacea MUCL 33604]|uniref:Uncharacterized protein n=1 Tax=Jaapia argillacea MUCL 33604 TaxID=933084 RepID=A0A067QKG3_9AGAM|nr:hypothetical protein JAAARDRAFT_214606 [Jaapia argillacea MUCL 33604]